MKRLIFALALTCAAGEAPGQTEIHLAPDGDDRADGTPDQPLQSLVRAQELVRARRLAEPGIEVLVLLHGGTWRIAEPLRFGPEDGGDAKARVTWRGLDGATISGGRPISGWTVRDGTWTAAIPAGWTFRELFVDGARRPRARHPDHGYLRVVAAAADRRSGFTFGAGDLEPVPDLDSVELVFLHDWSISRVGLSSIDAATSTLTTRDPIGGSAAHYAIDHFEQHPRYFVENSVAWRDQPGEWHLDPGTRTLTYLPLDGEDPTATGVVAPLATALIEVRGEDARPVTNLHFEGITFEHCAWSIPARGYAEGQANFHEPRNGEEGILRETIPAALSFELAVGCTVANAELRRLGTAGLRFGSRCVDCELRDSRVDDVSGNGVLVGEDQGRQVDGAVWWQAAPEQIARGNAVRRSTISRCGQQFFGAVGVWVGFARSTQIVDNELRDLPYTGVSLGWIWNPTPTPCGGHLVHDNHIHHVMQVLSDGGGIYTLGRQPGTVLSANRIHDVPVNLGRAESNGMFLDEGTTAILIEGNQIWNIDRAPLRFHRATTNLVRGNLLVLRGDAPPVRFNSTRPENIRMEANVLARQL
jgi:hypothetical protein